MKLEYIEWTDAMQLLEGWQELNEAKEWANSEAWVVKQTGFIIEENKKYLLLCSKMTSETENSPSYYGALIKIPIPWILKRINLTKHIK